MMFSSRWNLRLYFILVICTVLALCSNTSTNADDKGVAALTQAQQDENLNKVAAFAQKTADSALAIIHSSDTDKVKSDRLTKLFLDSVDVLWMARWAIGRNWRTMTNEEKTLYLDTYKNYLVATYVPKFKQYNGQSFNMTGNKFVGSQPMPQYLTTTQFIYQDTQKKVDVAYRTQIYPDGHIMIIDIVAENVSLLTSQRSEFQSIISRNGGIAALIKTMKDKINSVQ